MNRRRVILAAVVAAALITVIPLEQKPDLGPVSDGRPLGEWVSLISVRNLASLEWNQRGSNAIRKLGTNALPYLARWGRYEPKRHITKECARFVLLRVPAGSAPVRLQQWAFVDPDLVRADGVPIALRFLGPMAEGVITQLSAAAKPGSHTEWRVTNFFTR